MRRTAELMSLTEDLNDGCSRIMRLTLSISLKQANSLGNSTFTPSHAMTSLIQLRHGRFHQVELIFICAIKQTDETMNKTRSS